MNYDSDDNYICDIGHCNLHTIYHWQGREKERSRAAFIYEETPNGKRQHQKDERLQ